MVHISWTESGLFYATWRDDLKNVIALDLTANGNAIALSAIGETPDYASVTDPSTWTTSNEVTGGANWPTGGIQLTTVTYAPTVTQSPSKTLMYDANNLSIANTTTTAAAFGAYIYAAALTPKAKIMGVWFGGSGYTTIAGTFAVTWNVLGILTIQMAA